MTEAMQTLRNKLQDAGFSKEETKRLIANRKFVLDFKNKNADFFEQKIGEIADAYGTRKDQARKAVVTFPRFAGLDHKRVLKGIQNAYGATKDQARKAVLTHPPFASYNHKRVLKGIQDAYGATKDQARKAVLTHPPFAGLDHERVLKGIRDTHGSFFALDKSEMADLVLRHPYIAGISKRRHEGFIQILRMPSIKLRLKHKGRGISRKKLWEWIKKTSRPFFESPYVQLRYPNGEIKKATVEEAMAEMRARKARLHGKPSFLKSYRKAFRV